jgi:uncharacterized protein YndB with AHSA1/START domain/DNA-binding transcriptional ArsR family regulator
MPFGVTDAMKPEDDTDMDRVFKALADPSRRELLDRLRLRNGQRLTELCDGLGMARQSVTKHLAVLEAAGLVLATRRGRERLHFLNAAPIDDIADRWIGRYHRPRAEALTHLKHQLEDSAMTDTDFVYATYIKTTPAELWEALTSPEFTLRYWGAALRSDWQVGSPVLWQSGDGQPQDLDQHVLEADPPRRLAYTWHNYQPEHAELFGWDEASFAQLLTEPRSQVSFDIEAQGTMVRLTVTHSGGQPGGEMLRAVAGRNPKTGGWPQILANLKTFLETGQPLYDAA